MKSYAVLWGIGLVIVVLGFVIPLAGGPDWFSWLILVGFFLGVAGFLTFVKRGQGTAT